MCRSRVEVSIFLLLYRRLANVSGTIPVIYKQNTYNIPVCVWLKLDHPNSCPMAFVTPTKDMQIKVSHHVDQTGRIYLPYLEEWRYPDSSLIGLIEICRATFGELPPVFAKTKSASSTSGADSSQNGHIGKCLLAGSGRFAHYDSIVGFSPVRSGF